MPVCLSPDVIAMMRAFCCHVCFRRADASSFHAALTQIRGSASRARRSCANISPPLILPLSRRLMFAADADMMPPASLYDYKDAIARLLFHATLDTFTPASH